MSRVMVSAIKMSGTRGRMNGSLGQSPAEFPAGGTITIVPALTPVGPAKLGYSKMRLLVGLIIIIYLVGVGVVLSPTIRSGWSSEPKLSLGRIDRLYRPAPLCGRYRPSNGRAFFRMDVAAVDGPARPIAIERRASWRTPFGSPIQPKYNLPVVARKDRI